MDIIPYKQYTHPAKHLKIAYKGVFQTIWQFLPTRLKMMFAGRDELRVKFAAGVSWSFSIGLSRLGSLRVQNVYNVASECLFTTSLTDYLDARKRSMSSTPPSVLRWDWGGYCSLKSVHKRETIILLPKQEPF